MTNKELFLNKLWSFVENNNINELIFYYVYDVKNGVKRSESKTFIKVKDEWLGEVDNTFTLDRFLNKFNEDLICNINYLTQMEYPQEIIDKCKLEHIICKKGTFLNVASVLEDFTEDQDEYINNKFYKIVKKSLEAGFETSILFFPKSMESINIGESIELYTNKLKIKSIEEFNDILKQYGNQIRLKKVEVK